MKLSEFEALVGEVLDDLPAEFSERLLNVEIVVEEEPSADLLRSMGMHPRRDTLFGLYEGVPLDLRGYAFGNSLPDRITIFYRPLLHACRTTERLRREIRKTVIHEIGHHFGLDDDSLHRDGY